MSRLNNSLVPCSNDKNRAKILAERGKAKKAKPQTKPSKG